MALSKRSVQIIEIAFANKKVADAFIAKVNASTAPAKGDSDFMKVILADNKAGLELVNLMIAKAAKISAAATKATADAAHTATPGSAPLAAAAAAADAASASADAAYAKLKPISKNLNQRIHDSLADNKAADELIAAL